jgi:GGDEF domain-containing protein
MTVNVTCTDCDGAPPCGACAAAARAIAAAGFTVHHSSRYAALRAAASGTYGFDACIVPIGKGERAVADAAAIVLALKRVALVLDDGAARPDGIPAHFTIVEKSAYEHGSLPTGWLTDTEPIRTMDDTATRSIGKPLSIASDDQLRATRRVKTLANVQRERVAAIDGAPASLDMMAMLSDEVGWARASGLGFGLVLFHLGGLAERAAGGNADSVTHVAIAALRSSARRGDVIAYKNDDFVVLLPEADAAGAVIAARRAAGTLAAGVPGLPAPPRKAKGLGAWSAGVAACPADGYSREALIARATADLRPLDRWVRDR